MNNRTQQRFDRSIRDAVQVVQAAKDQRHAAQQAHAAESARPSPATRTARVARLSEADKLHAYDAGVRHPLLGHTPTEGPR